jgi:alcohol dehydrogenase
MRAVRYDEVAGPLRVVEVAAPRCPDDGVVLNVRATGVCRSDWHAWRGHEPVALPHIPGHEYAGVVAAIGPEVRSWQAGDRVTVPFVCGCGTCEYCLAGDAQVCPHQRQPGFTEPGSFAEQVAVPAADINLVRLPDAMPFTTAASLGCRFATAFRAVTGHGRVAAGDRVAVFGCGGVGLSAVMIASALGAQVVAVDRSAAALQRAMAAGAVATVRSTDDQSAEDLAEQVGEVHVAVECLGRPRLLRASVLALRRRGRHVQVGLLLGDESRPAVPMDRVIAHELELYGSHGMAAHEYPAMLQMIADGRLRPGDLVGRVIGLEDAGRALAAMDRPDPSGGMTVIEF